MPLLTDLTQHFPLRDAGLLTGAASFIYTGTITGAAWTALLSRSPERRRAARDVLALLLGRSEQSGKPDRADIEPGETQPYRERVQR